MPFDTIIYGPFEAKYHRKAVNNTFKKHLVDYLTSVLLPQVTIHYDESSGDLQAVCDHDKNCGPNSLVKNIYRIRFQFKNNTESESIEQEIIYYPASGAWKTRWRRPLLLQTVKRRYLQEKLMNDINAICKQIENRSICSAECPLCRKEISITNQKDLFDVRCANGCFCYNYHRDPDTGQFLHGHSFINQDKQDETK